MRRRSIAPRGKRNWRGRRNSWRAASMTSQCGTGLAPSPARGRRCSSPSPSRMTPKGFGRRKRTANSSATPLAGPAATHGFLAELFVSPDAQAQGVGGELLKRALDTRGGAARFIARSSLSPSTRRRRASYARSESTPRYPVYFVKGERDAIQVSQSRSAAEMGADASFIPPLQELSRASPMLRRSAPRGPTSRIPAWRSADGGGAALRTGSVRRLRLCLRGRSCRPACRRTANLSALAFATALEAALEGGATHVTALLPGVNDALESGPCAGPTHHIADDADGDAGPEGLDAVSAAQSRIHVTGVRDAAPLRQS